MDITKIRDKLLNHNYFSVKDWRNEMDRFFEALKEEKGLDEVYIDGKSEFLSSLGRKFNDLWEEHKMDLYSY